MMYTAALQTKTARQRAQHFAWDAACGLRDEADEAADNAERMLAGLKYLGTPATTLESVKDALRDAFGDAQGAINKELDDHGLATDQHQIDMAWLEEV